jgi:membrane protease YdiL (CAAX protease family)
MRHWLLALEISAWVAIGVADAYGMVPLSRTPFLFALGWLSLRLRGLRWRDVGLAAPPRWTRAIVVGVLLGVGMEVVSTFVTVPLFTRLTGQPPELSEFRFVVGNVKALMLMLLANWILAAFGEELAYRAYVTSRIADAVKGNWIVALVAGSLYFGWGHEAQDITGVIQESLAGLVLGIAYLANRRNLTVPIVAHGVSNSVAFVLIYLDLYPGV